MKRPSFAFILPLLSFVVAAPQGSSICGQVPQNPAAGQIAAQYLQVPGCGNGPDGGSTPKVANDAGSNSNDAPAPTTITGPIASGKPQGPSTNNNAVSGNTTTPGSGGGKCPPGFRNTVFNTGAPRNAGWPQTTWDSLTANGVNDWSESKFFYQ